MDEMTAAQAFFDANKNRRSNENKSNDFRAKSFYMQAKEFYLSSNLLFEQKRLDMMNVILSNLAFACELFLKSLLYYFNRPVKGAHGLKELFDGLEDTEKDFIRRNIFAVSQHHDDFELCLKEQDNAYTNYRYACETERYTGDYNFLVCFASILKYVCSKNLDTE